MYTEQEFHLSRNSYFLKYYEKTATSIKLLCRFHMIEFKPFIKCESLIFLFSCTKVAKAIRCSDSQANW